MLSEQNTQYYQLSDEVQPTVTVATDYTSVPSPYVNVNTEQKSASFTAQAVGSEQHAPFINSSQTGDSSFTPENQQNTFNEELIHFPPFESELTDEKLVTTFKCTKKRYETFLETIIRILVRCNCRRPSFTQAVTITNKRIITILHSIYSEAAFHTETRSEFLKNLDSVEETNSSRPKIFYNKFKTVRGVFTFLYLVPVFLHGLSLGIAFAHTIAAAVFTTLAFLMQIVAVISIMAILGYMKKHEMTIETPRTIALFLLQSLSMIVTLALFITEYAVPQEMPAKIACLVLHAICLYTYCSSFNFYPYYIHFNKTKFTMVYDTVTLCRKQDLYLPRTVATQCKKQILALKNDIASMDKIISV